MDICSRPCKRPYSPELAIDAELQRTIYTLLHFIRPSEVGGNPTSWRKGSRGPGESPRRGPSPKESPAKAGLVTSTQLHYGTIVMIPRLYARMQKPGYGGLRLPRRMRRPESC